MSLHALRSTYARARPDIEAIGRPLHSYFRLFSTTHPPQADADPATHDDNNNNNSNNSKPVDVRARALAAASQINTLVRRRAEPRDPTAATAGRPNIIDVKSIPRGLGRGRALGATSANRFAPGNRSAPRGRGGAAAAAAAGSRRGRGGKRGGGGRAPRRGGSGGEEAAAPGAKRTDPSERMDAAERSFDEAMRFGTRTAWGPGTSGALGSALAEMVPAMPSASAAGRVASVMQDLSVLGTADAVGVPAGLQARDYAADVEGNGWRFFADVGARRAAEEYLAARGGPAVHDAEEAVRQVVLERAVVGRFEEPRFAEARDAVGVARAWHLRAGTWTAQDVDKFEKTIVPLLQRYG